MVFCVDNDIEYAIQRKSELKTSQTRRTSKKVKLRKDTINIDIFHMAERRRASQTIHTDKKKTQKKQNTKTLKTSVYKSRETGSGGERGRVWLW